MAVAKGRAAFGVAAVVLLWSLLLFAVIILFGPLLGVLVGVWGVGALAMVAVYVAETRTERETAPRAEAARPAHAAA